MSKGPMARKFAGMVGMVRPVRHLTHVEMWISHFEPSLRCNLREEFERPVFGRRWNEVRTSLFRAVTVDA